MVFLMTLKTSFPQLLRHLDFQLLQSISSGRFYCGHRHGVEVLLCTSSSRTNRHLTWSSCSIRNGPSLDSSTHPTRQKEPPLVGKRPLRPLRQKPHLAHTFPSDTTDHARATHDLCCPRFIRWRGEDIKQNSERGITSLFSQFALPVFFIYFCNIAYA